jgi:predicted TIM-barrel fold metal-dependent hydrolase
MRIPPIIDAHIHIFRPTPAFYELLERRDIRMLNIAVVDKFDPGFEDAAQMHAWLLEVFRKSRGRVAWCSTFDPADWESGGFAERAIGTLEQTFNQGAVAVKIYKDLGMKLKSRDGEYVLPDNPVFRPILERVAQRDKTLYAHIAEPLSAWLPLERQPPHHRAYYEGYPDWHMYGSPETPSKETILAARDRMVGDNPGLRIVGCHLGSMEEDVDEITKRLDLYPNFAVDASGRIPDLMLEPREKTRAFLLRHQDRILYGTDIVWVGNQPEEMMLRQLEDTYDRDWKYLATGERLNVDGREVQGLELPEPVLRKIYSENALRWVPGLAGIPNTPRAPKA